MRSVRTILDTVTDARRRELPVSSASDESDDGASERVRLPVYLEALAMRLLPLRHIEALLIAKLVPPNETEATHLGFCGSDVSSDDGSVLPGLAKHREVFVRPGATWKAGMLGRVRMYGRPQSAGTTGQETQDESQQVLDELREDMIALWKDRTVKEILKRRKIRLEESPGL